MGPVTVLVLVHVLVTVPQLVARHDAAVLVERLSLLFGPLLHLLLVLLGERLALLLGLHALQALLVLVALLRRHEFLAVDALLLLDGLFGLLLRADLVRLAGVLELLLGALPDL